ncbi:MAG: hypothetical protein NTZ50_06745 [Chloroflexi bacterium]|nr:hypothetical protein [Chloroflexota bacterium]
MISGIIGLLMAMLALINGFAAMRRPLDKLVEFDPFGKRILAARGPKFTIIAYRIFGFVLVVVGMIVAYLSLQMLRGG